MFRKQSFDLAQHLNFDIGLAFFQDQVFHHGRVLLEQGLFKGGELVGFAGVVINGANEFARLPVVFGNLVERHQVDFAGNVFPGELFFHNIFMEDRSLGKVVHHQPLAGSKSDDAVDQVMAVQHPNLFPVVVNPGVLECLRIDRKNFH